MKCTNPNCNSEEFQYIEHQEKPTKGENISIFIALTIIYITIPLSNLLTFVHEICFAVLAIILSSITFLIVN